LSWLRACPLVILVAALYFALWASVEHAKLTIKVESAQISFEPGFVRLKVRVEPDADNRALAVGIVGPDFETNSLEQLDAQSPITRWREFKDVPAGEYQAVAEVVRADGTSSLASARLVILPR
jgi:hypothetical protein